MAHHRLENTRDRPRSYSYLRDRETSWSLANRPTRTLPAEARRGTKEWQHDGSTAPLAGDQTCELAYVEKRVSTINCHLGGLYMDSLGATSSHSIEPRPAVA